MAATDPNGETMTYSLGGTDMGSFDIDQMTGQITVKTATKLDLEAKATYMVTVTATDPGGLTDSVDVTIKLTDKDEAPVIAGDDISKDYPENGTGSSSHPQGHGPGEDGQCTGRWRRTMMSLLLGGIETADDYVEQSDEFSISARRGAELQLLPRLRDDDGWRYRPTYCCR